MLQQRQLAFSVPPNTEALGEGTVGVGIYYGGFPTPGYLLRGLWSRFRVSGFRG